MTPARTRLLLVVALIVVVNLAPLHALLTGRGLDGDQVSSLVLTNLALVVGVGVYVAMRGRTRPELRMVATEDLVATGAEPALERIQGNDYVVRGEVTEVGAEHLWLQVVDRRVRVLLDGREVPAVEGVVEVRGTMIG